MTTSTGPTPFDKDVAELVVKKHDSRYTIFYWLAVGQQSGYRRAKAEAAPLLEAAKSALDAFNTLDSPSWGVQVRLQLRAAITGYEGKTTR